MTYVALIGSLRRESLNRKLFHAACKLVPDGTTLVEAAIGDLPFYNQDVHDQGLPGPVVRLGNELRAADGIVFVTPEYNYSVPGVLKNAIDWVSRLPDQPFKAKPAAIMGASPGKFGTARAQYHLRQIGVFLDLRFVNVPEVMLGGAAQAFDAQGDLQDQMAKDLVRKQMLALHDAALAAKSLR